MRNDLPPAYEPKTVEDEIYRRWEKSGFFNPDNLLGKRPKPFSIIMPPPNANGALHIGHALFVTLQDIMIRFHRMRGEKTLWLPGADHAGIETEFVYRKKLEKEGRRWNEIPRDELYREIFEFSQKNKVTMENQLRKLGASCDWSREKFTLDPEIVEKVQETFIQMYRDGLIYRGSRIVNWSVKDQTALSDLEIKYETETAPLYAIKYGPLEVATVRPETKFGDTAIAVHPKDTRYKQYVGRELEVETLLGKARIKVIADPVVDPDFGTGAVKVTPAHDLADFEMGLRHTLEVRQVIDRYGRLNEKTGPYQGLKVEEARKKVVEDMTAKGLIRVLDQNYQHAVAKSARSGGVIEPLVMPQWFVRMTQSGNRTQKTEHKKSLRDLAVEAVKKKEITFIPARYEKIFFNWMKELRDWNISRQIIWGIQIPAWYCTPVQVLPIMGFYKGVVPQVLKGKTRTYRINDHGYKVGDLIALENSQTKTLFGHAVIEKIERRPIKDIKLPDALHGGGYKTLEELLPAFRRHYPPDRIITEDTEVIIYDFRFIPLTKESPSGGCKEIIVAENQPISCPNCGGKNLVRDPEVLDTWFSSGQWPFLTLLTSGEQRKSGIRNKESGLPYTTDDFEEFYPTSVMETGWDIFFFWVARMIMLGIYRTGKVPFKTVYLHGLVRDKERQKMSKSKGNVIDPLGVAEQYGTDAVRMALIVGNTPGNDPIISEEKIRGYRNFANKIWNASRFILMNREDTGYRIQDSAKRMKFSKEDKKRLAEWVKIKKTVTKDLEEFRFHLAAEQLYHYFWHTFADKIIESAKPRLKESSPDRDAAATLLHTILRENLIMLHPFMPFVTEAIWEKLEAGKNLLLVEPWPVDR